MSDLLQGLAEVVRQLDDPDNWKVQRNFIHNHHAEIARNAEAAKRLRALEQAMGEYAHPSSILDINMRADEIMLGGE